MKIKILLSFLFLAFYSVMTGQVNMDQNKLKNNKKDTTSYYFMMKDSLNTVWDFYKEGELNQKLLTLDSFSFNKKRYPVTDQDEQYPGASRFYAIRPNLRNYMYTRKSFLIKPDRSAKYYLIIKDPVSHNVFK